MPDPRPLSRSHPSRPRPWLLPLLRRLHTTAGLVVAPFIVVAALSGALYALSTPLEGLLYREQLTAPVGEQSLSIAEQVEAADAYLGGDRSPSAVRPAPEPGATTRVMYAEEGLAPSESLAVFVDPSTGDIRGELIVYGTSGALPLRTWIDQFHRGLHLGDPGRLYSEFAASWMGVVALAGIVLWVAGLRRAPSRPDMLRPRAGLRGRRRLLSWHAPLGILLAVGMLFLAATGITWSQYGGSTVSAVRAQLSWTTPEVETALPGGGSAANASGLEGHQGHSGHEGHEVATDPAMFDQVLAVGRSENIDVGEVEIRPASDDSSAWVVQEIQRRHPTSVDAVAVDPGTLEVVDRVDFTDYGLMAKLARWGIDLHMGSMFGLANQIVMAVVAVGIAAVASLGALMWWRRRPPRPGQPLRRGPGRVGSPPWWGIALVIGGAVAISLALPMIGLGLLAFLLVDGVQAVADRRRPRT